jgi:hypothetical protein
MLVDDYLTSKVKRHNFNLQQILNLPLYFLFFGAFLGMNGTDEWCLKTSLIICVKIIV